MTDWTKIMNDWIKRKNALIKTASKAFSKMDDEQKQAFAWRCAIRVLPLFTRDKRLSYWKQPSKNLDFIFKCLDMMSYGGLYTIDKIRKETIKVYGEGETEEEKEEMQEEINSAVSTFFEDLQMQLEEGVYDETGTALGVYHGDVDPEEFAKYGEQYDDFYDNVTFPYSLETVNSAYEAVGLLQRALMVFEYTTSSYMDSNNAQKIALATVDAARMSKPSLDLYDAIMEDLKSFIAGEKPQISLKTYGKDWEQFKSVIENITPNLKEWIPIYEKIFTQNFEMDVEALKQRLEGYDMG